MDPVGMVLSAFLEVLFDRVVSPAVLNFFKAKKLDDGLLRKLEITLIVVNKVLDDAEEKQFTDEAVKKWVEKLQDAVYDAEDLLDAVNTEAMQLQMEKEAQPKKAKSKLKLKVRNFFKSSTHSHGEIETKLKEILERLEDIVKPIDVLGLKQGVAVGVPENPNKKLPSTSLPDERKVYGRDKDKESVVKLLLAENSSDDKLSVITIKGMGGVGKTTLAQLVYSDDEIVQHFELRAWVCISEEFDVVKVTRTILQEVTSSISVTDSLNLLQVELKKKLEDKRFLVVLDDVWNEKREDWDLLKKPFQHGAKGGKILVTTRNEGVAQIMRTVPTHTLEKLSDEDCWELFAKYAFEGGESQAHPSLRDMGQQIVKKCGGLPLAAKALGGLLGSKKTVEEWSQIMESNLWDLKNCNILPVLRVSYHYLPPPLKRCFAFASIFSKDCLFRKDRLILLWAAQSFFPEGKNVLDIGGSYFDELLSRSFFQRSTYESYFVMHDLMHDLATFVSGQSCRCVNLRDIQEITNTTRHVSYSIRSIKQFQTLPTANRLRTFIPVYHGYSSPIEISNELGTRFKVLRALSLAPSGIEVLPATIGSLKHLRFFDLSKTSIKSLPNSVCDLYNLQTLILTHCRELIELSTDIWKLVNLHWLDVSGCYKLREMPRNMGKLKNLARLGIFKVGKDSTGAKIGELGQLSNLGGKLSILGLQNVKSAADAEEARLKDKKYLEELELSWDSDQDGPRKDYEVIEKLQPHRSLKILTIKGYVGERFPNWIGDEMYSNTVSLTLKNSIGCRSIAALGQLPSLKELNIYGFANLQTLDSEFYGNSYAAKPFGSLEILWIKDMPLWEEWFCRDGESFHLLREFRLENCPKLRGNLPAHLPTLIKLEIYDCPDLTGLLPKAPALSDLSLRNSNEMLLNHLPQGLKSLEIFQFDTLTSLPEATFSSTLKSLNIDSCSKLELPMHQEFASLERLTVEKCCHSLQSFPLQNFPKLYRLKISGCDNLESFSSPDETIHEFLSLTQLEIRGCKKFLGFSDGGYTFPNLRSFAFLYNDEAMELPNQMQSFKFLEEISLSECPKIEALLGGGLPSSLTRLHISGCDKFMGELLDRGLHGLNSLEYLIIGKCKGVVSFPPEGLLPKSLRCLIIKSFDDLETLEHKGFEHLTSLSRLEVRRCPKLKCIPPEGLPASLTMLDIEDCPLLERRLQRDGGEDWDKIAHIPRVHIVKSKSIE